MSPKVNYWLALTVLLCSCSEKRSGESARSVLVTAIESDITNLHPWVNNTVNANDIFSLLYTPLFYEDIKWNKQSEFKPRWVESYQFSSDSLKLTLNLNRTTFWSDGIRANAFDVEFSQKMLSSDSVGIYRSPKQNISSVTAVDSFTVEVRFKTRSLYQLMDLNDGYILPVHIFRGMSIDQIKENESYKRNPVTNGKFIIKSRTMNNEIRLVRRYPSDNPESVHEIVFKIIPDPIVRLNLLQNGEINLLPNLPVNQLSAVKDNRKFTVRKYPYSSTEYIVFNLEHPVLKNLKIRQLISAALDRTKITQTALGEEGEPLNTIFPKGFWATDTLPDRKVDTSDAASIIPKPGQKEFSLKIASTNEARVRAGYSIKEQLAVFGISVKLELLPSDILAKEVRSGNYDMAVWGTREGTKPNLSLRYFKSAIGTSNLTRYSNPEFERIHELAVNEFDSHKSLVYWSALQKMLLDEAVVVPLFQRNKIDVFSSDILYSESNSRSVLNNIDNWRLSPRHE